MKSKYPGNHFERYMDSCTVNGILPHKRDFAQLAKKFLKVEGVEEFKSLIREIQEIKTSKDWTYFGRQRTDNRFQWSKELLVQAANAAEKVHRSIKVSQPAEKIKKENNSNYINEYVEWQEHQFQKGYYSGGKLPPVITSPGKPQRLRIVLMVIALWSIIMIAISLYISFDFMKTLPGILILVLIVGLGSVLTVFGKKKSKPRRKGNLKQQK